MAYTFQELTTAITPTSLYRGEMVYDITRSRVVFPPTQPSTDGLTWEFYANDWHSVSTATTPPNQGDYGACYDAANNVTATYYHLLDGNDTRQTWTYDGADWTLIWSEQAYPVDNVVNQPKVSSPEMVYVDTMGVVLLVGTDDTSIDFQTWTWDGTTWTELSPATSPPGEIEFSMAYDSVRDRVVLVTRKSSGVGADTWEWDGTDWTKILSSSPVQFGGTSMAFDATIAKCVLVIPDLLAASNPVYTYAGSAWASEGSSGPGGTWHQIAYFPPYAGVVLFGGYDSSAHPGEGDPRTWVAETRTIINFVPQIYRRL